MEIVFYSLFYLFIFIFILMQSNAQEGADQEDAAPMNLE